MSIKNPDSFQKQKEAELGSAGTMMDIRKSHRFCSKPPALAPQLPAGSSLLWITRDHTSAASVSELAIIEVEVFHSIPGRYLLFSVPLTCSGVDPLIVLAETSGTSAKSRQLNHLSADRGTKNSFFFFTSKVKVNMKSSC